MTRQPSTPVAPPWPPSILEISAAPEMAILTALVALLDIAGDALFVAHPELGDDDDERPYWKPLPPTVPHAGRILRSAASLRRAIRRYRRAVTPAPPPAEDPGPADDHFPF
jgi:hypothetical protein